MRVLVIDDDEQILNFLKSNLEAECFAVDAASDGESGSFLGRTNDYDVIIIDNEMPKKNGREVCFEIREKNKKVKIIMLSVLADVSIKVDLINSGADDYMTKPFSFAELLARTQSLLRRNESISSSQIIKVRDIELDIEKGQVKQGGKTIYLTRKEFMLLAFLMKNIGRVITQGEMIEHVWDSELDSFSNTFKTHVKNLRRKLDKDPKRSFIQTISGRGYRISED